MKWLVIIKLGFLILSKWFEKNDRKREQKKEAIDEVKEGIKTKDTSRITAGDRDWETI